MTIASVRLSLNVRSYWLHAHGEGGGADFDLIMDRDEDGLPLLRGKHVAGLLRLALERAAAWGWFGDDGAARDIPILLMGDEGAPGCLDVRSARIPEPLRSELRLDPELGAACFRRIASTAMDSIRSVAKEKHLRTVEAAVPLPLVFTVGFAPDDRRFWAEGQRSESMLADLDTAERHWVNWLKLAWPAFDEAGAKRTRGFGRVGWAEFPDQIQGASA